MLVLCRLVNNIPLTFNCVERFIRRSRINPCKNLSNPGDIIQEYNYFFFFLIVLLRELDIVIVLLEQFIEYKKEFNVHLFIFILTENPLNGPLTW